MCDLQQQTEKYEGHSEYQSWKTQSTITQLTLCDFEMENFNCRTHSLYAC